MLEQPAHEVVGRLREAEALRVSLVEEDVRVTLPEGHVVVAAVAGVGFFLLSVGWLGVWPAKVLAEQTAKMAPQQPPRRLFGVQGSQKCSKSSQKTFFVYQNHSVTLIVNNQSFQIYPHSFVEHLLHIAKLLEECQKECNILDS